MGRMKWGGYCPRSISWNGTRYRKGLCTGWQRHLYMTWYDHGKRGFIPSDDSFMNFANVVYWFEKQPMASAFKQNHELYDFDKDGLGGHMFTASSLQIVTQQQNLAIMRSQNPNLPNPITYPGASDKQAKSRARPVHWIDPNGVEGINEYGANGIEREFGIPRATVSHICHGYNMSGNTVINGKWKGWTFEFV